MKNPSELFCAVREFGVIGDGVSDDTNALQGAIDTLGDAGGGVLYFPGGRYLVSHLVLRDYVHLLAHPSWSYHEDGAVSIVRMECEHNHLVDLSNTRGVRLSGLSFFGGDTGVDIGCLYLNCKNRTQENTVFIEKCRISHFTGDAIYTESWGTTIRENMIIFNQGHGIHFQRWDGWIFDNIINNNHGYGVYAPKPSASVTMTGNRIEWNRSGGVFMNAANHYQINSNYFDRSGGPGIYLTGAGGDGRGHTHTITGNIIHRSGALIGADMLENCHIYLDHQSGVSCTGNVMSIGRNDNNGGNRSPSYGVVYKDLDSSVIRNNTLFHGAVKKLMVELDGTCGDCYISDNPGTLA